MMSKHDGDEALALDIEELGKDGVALDWLIHHKGFDVNARVHDTPKHLHYIDAQVTRDKDWPLLTLAVLSNNPRLCLLLVANGADLDATNSNNDTALHWAIGNGHDECAVELIARGARFDLVNGYNSTALSLAECRGLTPKAYELMQRMKKK